MGVGVGAEVDKLPGAFKESQGLAIRKEKEHRCWGGMYRSDKRDSLGSGQSPDNVLTLCVSCSFVFVKPRIWGEERDTFSRGTVKLL